MEIKLPFTLNGIIFTIIFVAILWWSLKLLNWVWWRPKMLEKKLRQQGLKGTPYKVFFGDLKDLDRMAKQAQSRPIELDHDILPRVFPFFDQIIKNYGGKASFAWLGPMPILIIMNPEHIKEIFTRINDFKKIRLHPLVYYLITGLVTYDGTKWAQTRKIVNPAFHIEKLKLMMPAFHDSVSDVIKQWEELLSTDKGTTSSCELDVFPYLQKLTSDAISRTAFGSSYEQGRRIFELIKSLSKLTNPFLNSIYIPGSRFLPTRTNMKIKAINKEIQQILIDEIKKRENAIRAGESTKDDLLSLLIKSNLGEIEEHGNSSKKFRTMSTQDVINECKLFYFAGQETTSVLLVWTLILLAKHPEWQERARQEIFQAFGHDTKPNFDGLNHLKVVTAIVYEILRLYPPVGQLVRVVHKEAKLENLLLPQGVIVLLAPIFTHRSEELWGKDASEFNPNRFFDGVSKATENQLSFFPFAWGPRICIGMNFAILEAKMAIAMMLQKFSFDVSPSYAHAPSYSITLQPQHGAHLILHKL